MSVRTLPRLLQETSPAVQGTVVGTKIVGSLGGFGAVSFVAEIQGATGGALDVYLQSSFDDGATWWDYAHFTQLAAAAPVVRYRFAATLHGNAVISAVGKNGSPALAGLTVVAGHPGDAMRFVFVAAASTSAGAVQSVYIAGSNDRR